MTSKNIQDKLKNILIKWTNSCDAVYMTDDETGAEGVIVSEDIVCSIQKEDDEILIYYKGNHDPLTLLNFYLFENDLDVKIIEYE